LVAVIEVKHDSRLDLFRLNNLRIIQAHVEGIGVFIKADLRSLPPSLGLCGAWLQSFLWAYTKIFLAA
jgi:hypothetical protein